MAINYKLSYETVHTLTRQATAKQMLKSKCVASLKIRFMRIRARGDLQNNIQF